VFDFACTRACVRVHRRVCETRFSVLSDNHITQIVVVNVMMAREARPKQIDTQHLKWCNLANLLYIIVVSVSHNTYTHK
jgi:hypothetical protein